MHVELTDLFRCPARHRDSWLVAAAHRTESRVILDGVLGCPECRAEYAIRDGVALFNERTSAPGDEPVDADPDFPLRIAALLNVTDSGGTIAMIGAPAVLALGVQAVVPTRCVVVDAPDEASALRALRAGDAPLAIIRSNGTLPVGSGALDGVYARAGDPSIYTAALRAGGRMVAPADRALPEGITELARDDMLWVGERVRDPDVTPSGLTELRRRR